VIVSEHQSQIIASLIIPNSSSSSTSNVRHQKATYPSISHTCPQPTQLADRTPHPSPRLSQMPQNTWRRVEGEGGHTGMMARGDAKKVYFTSRRLGLHIQRTP
jgi:hypothetical protein